MNREILFRGKTLDTDAWVTGHLVISSSTNDPSIIVDYDVNCTYAEKVKIDKISQFTGLVDKNGVKIFEGDILNSHCGNLVASYNVEQACFEFNLPKEKSPYIKWGVKAEYLHKCEVIGNIFDNPELLKGLGN